MFSAGVKERDWYTCAPSFLNRPKRDRYSLGMMTLSSSSSTIPSPPSHISPPNVRGGLYLHQPQRKESPE